MKNIPFTIRLAEVSIAIVPRHCYIRELCQGYLWDGPSESIVTTGPEDYALERSKLCRTGNLTPETASRVPDWYLESLAVHRKIARALLPYGVLLFHGSCIAVDGKGYLFTAKSGTGKSTHTRLWREHFGSRAFMVNDDKPLVRITEQGAVVYGTPWDGKHHLSTNTSVPLKALCVLERGEKNEITPIHAGEGFPFFLNQIYRPDTPEEMKNTLSLLNGILSETSLYRLRCNMESSAAAVSYEGMQGKESL